MKKLIIIGVLWCTCGAYNYAATLAHFTEEYGYMRNLPPAIGMALFGPFGTAVVLTRSGHPTHLLWKPLTNEQRWMIFNAKEPGLGRCYFEEEYGSGTSCETPVDDLQLLHSLEAGAK